MRATMRIAMERLGRVAGLSLVCLAAPHLEDGGGVEDCLPSRLRDAVARSETDTDRRTVGTALHP